MASKADMNSHDNGDRSVDSGLTRVTAWWQRWAILVLSMTALGVSLFLAWSTIKVGSIAGCGADGVFDCHHVLQSKWSKWMGIPVSIPAALLHMTLITFVLLSLTKFARRYPSRQQSIDGGIALLASCAALAGLWFVGLQVFSIGKLCQYCLVAHTSGVLLFIVMACSQELRPARLPRLGSLAFVLTMFLAAGQIFGPEQETSTVEVHEGPAEFELADMDFDDVDMDFEDEVLAERDFEVVLPADNAMTYVRQDGGDVSTLDIAVSDLESSDPTVNDASESVANTSLQPVGEAIAASPIATPTAVPPEEQNKEVAPFVPDSTDEMDLPNDSADEAPVPTFSPIPDEQDSAQQTSEGDAPRVLAIPGAKTRLKIKQWPMIGSAEAEVVLVELFDYTCAHCRDMSRQLEEARHRYGNQALVGRVAGPAKFQL